MKKTGVAVPVTSRARRDYKEKAMRGNKLVAALVAALFVPVGASAQPATSGQVKGTFTGQLDVGPIAAIQNQCGRKAPEVKDAEKKNCEAATNGATPAVTAKYNVAACFCDLSEINKAKAAGDELAFCHIESDKGSARNVHLASACAIEAQTVGARAAAYYAKAGLDGSPACKRVAKAKADSKTPKASDVEACKKNPGLKAQVADLGDRLDGIEEGMSDFNGRLGELESGNTVLVDELHGADEACARADAARTKAEEPEGADVAECQRNPGTTRIAKLAGQRVYRALVDLGKLEVKMNALEKGFTLGVGVMVGIDHQPDVRDSGATLRGDTATGYGLQVVAGVGDMRFVTSWVRVSEDATGANSKTGSVSGNEVAFRAMKMAWKLGPDLLLGIGGGVAIHATNQSMAFDAAGVQSFGVQFIPALEWRLVQHLALTAEVPVTYSWAAAVNNGVSKHPDGAGIGARVGIIVPLNLF